MNQVITNYSFSASAKTLTLTDFGTVKLERIRFVKNLTTNSYLYLFTSANTISSVLGNVITFNCSTAGMTDTDKLSIQYDDGVSVSSESTLISVNSNLGSDGSSPPTIAGSGVRGWLRAIYDKLAATLTVSVSNFPSTQPISGSVSVSNLPGTQPVSGTVTANIGTGSLAAGTNAIGDVGTQYRGNATGAASVAHLVSAASTNATVVKASAGRLLGWQLQNTTASIVYLKLHNTSTTPTAGASVYMAIAIPANGRTDFRLDGGIAFTNGIAFTTVTTSPDSGSTAVTLGSIVGSLFYA